MAEGNVEGQIYLIEETPSGHRIVYSLVFHGFHRSASTLIPIYYSIPCPTMPTSWTIELRCERESEESGLYDFSVRLSRSDSSNEQVSAAFSVSFFDENDTSVVLPVGNRGDEVGKNSELESIVAGIHPAYIEAVYAARVTLEIERCHEEEGESKLIIDNREPKL